MNARGEQFWFLVRDAAKEQRTAKSQAVHYWLTPHEDGLRLNDVGYPVGVSLRSVAKKIAELGYCNRKGAAYHPYQLQEMLFDGLADAVASIIPRRQLDLFEEGGVQLDDDHHQALRDAIAEGCRHKRDYDHEKPTEEELCRQSWRGNRRLKNRCKRQKPWDQHEEEREAA